MSEMLQTQLQVDVDKYIKNSKKVDIRDLDLSEAATALSAVCYAGGPCRGRYPDCRQVSQRQE
jgi:hypothetical protein